MDVFTFIMCVLGFLICIILVFFIARSTTTNSKDVEGCVWLGFYFGMLTLAYGLFTIVKGIEAFYNPEDGFKYSVDHVKELRIDTVFTVSKEKTDTMYIINYNKKD